MLLGHVGGRREQRRQAEKAEREELFSRADAGRKVKQEMDEEAQVGASTLISAQLVAGGRSYQRQNGINLLQPPRWSCAASSKAPCSTCGGLCWCMVCSAVVCCGRVLRYGVLGPYCLADVHLPIAALAADDGISDTLQARPGRNL